MTMVPVGAGRAILPATGGCGGPTSPAGKYLIARTPCPTRYQQISRAGQIGHGEEG
jgi:hypothetical protein